VKRQRVGDTGLMSSRLVLGTGGFGSKTGETSAATILDAYLDAGGTTLDTANIYGRRTSAAAPASELMLGRWLASRKIRGSVLISTKGGAPRARREGPGWLSRTQLRADLDDSLGNLGTDYVDLYWVHRDDPSRPVGDIVQTLRELRDEGKIRYFGVANWSAARTREAIALGAGTPVISAVQKMWNVAAANPGALDAQGMTFFGEDDAVLSAREGIPLFAYSSQAQGYFSVVNREDFATGGRYEPLRAFFDNPVSRERARTVTALAGEHRADPTSLALAALLCSPVEVYPIVGPADVAELQGSIAALEITLSPEELGRLDIGKVSGPDRRSER
jgi:aryl-alcohol dehydrogenase-like predicted oxidoreductase